MAFRSRRTDLVGRGPRRASKRVVWRHSISASTVGLDVPIDAKLCKTGASERFVGTYTCSRGVTAGFFIHGGTLTCIQLDSRFAAAPH